jgi:hypothetical protein
MSAMNRMYFGLGCVLAIACGQRATPLTATSAVIIANHCNGLSKQDSVRAQQTMNELVEHCDSVPHGKSTFSVVLYPDGSISFASSGDAGSDEIPMCVVSHRLRHKVKLTTECGMDVRLEQTQLAASQ